MTVAGVGYSPQTPAPSEPKKRGRPRKPQITLDRSPVVAPVPLPNAPPGRSFASASASLPPPAVLASQASEVSNPALLSDNTITVEEAKSSPATAPPTAAPTRVMPFSPQKRHINLIVRNSAKVLPRPGQTHASGDSTEPDEDFAAQFRKNNKALDRSTAANGVSKSAALLNSCPLARVAQNESTLSYPHVSPKPASIADAVTNISTDSEPSNSSTSEDDTDADETFHPKRGWAAVNTGSSASAVKAPTRGGGSVGTRGRGRGRGSTPVGGGNARARSKSGSAKIERGQQTLGSFFLKPLAVGVSIQQPALSAAGIEKGGAVAKRGGKRGTVADRVQNENENVDVEMKDS